MSKKKISILIVNSTQQRIPRNFLLTWVKSLSRELKKRGLIQDKLKVFPMLVFLNEKEALVLNKKYRGKNYATDVLSFDSIDDECLGELVMCPEVLKKQAKRHGWSFRLELAYMVLHGYLHLLGFDHEKSLKEAKIMMGLQDELFENLMGVPLESQHFYQ